MAVGITNHTKVKFLWIKNMGIQSPIWLSTPAHSYVVHKAVIKSMANTSTVRQQYQPQQSNISFWIQKRCSKNHQTPNSNQLLCLTKQ